MQENLPIIASVEDRAARRAMPGERGCYFPEKDVPGAFPPTPAIPDKASVPPAAHLPPADPPAPSGGCGPSIPGSPGVPPPVSVPYPAGTSPVLRSSMRGKNTVPPGAYAAEAALRRSENGCAVCCASPGDPDDAPEPAGTIRR